MKNPLAAAMGRASVERPEQAPHAKSLHSPTQKQQVRHKGRPAVEMKRSHGARASAVGRDMHRSSNMAPKIPGKREPSGIQVAKKGPMRFGDQGRG